MSCPNSVAAEGVTLTVGKPADFQVLDSTNGCAALSPAGITVASPGLGVNFSVTAGANAFIFTPIAPGPAVGVTFSMPGYADLVVQFTVVSGALDLVPFAG